ncbi:hypothetical protein AVEN_117756-1 [Araneus ventricosus]|uniref:Uncharacterized protein n=1 Tax=Araneus ventricosus TaxID=182803 RepID=A0A4Y2BAM3_ARAVE|nr:hypothetical protein AVEN_117756-1 [Araneus ventricosus]
MGGKTLCRLHFRYNFRSENREAMKRRCSNRPSVSFFLGGSTCWRNRSRVLIRVSAEQEAATAQQINETHLSAKNQHRPSGGIRKNMKIEEFFKFIGHHVHRAKLKIYLHEPCHKVLKNDP